MALTSCPATIAAVLLTIPKYSGYVLSSNHDIDIRVGSTAPSATVHPETRNTLCASQIGNLGTTAGDVVRIECTNGPVDGTIVTIHIR